MKQLDPNKVRIAVEGLPILAEVVEALSSIDQTPDMSKLALNSLSGDLIQGGTISKFKSTGIKDESSRLVVFVNDDHFYSYLNLAIPNVYIGRYPI